MSLNISLHCAARLLLRSFVVVAVSVFFYMSDSYAATYYVATTGSDGNNCTQAQSPSSPKRTIAGGMACLSSGDTLQIAAGTYAEGILANNLPSGKSWSATTKIIGAGQNSGTILRPTSGNGIYLDINKSYLEFIDFEIDHTNNSRRSAVSLDNGHHVRLKNLNIHHGDEGVIIKPAMSDVEIIGVESHHNGVPSCTGKDGRTVMGGYCHGLYLEGTNILVDKCSLHDNDGLGVQWYPGPSNGIMRNCIIYANRRQTAGGYPTPGVVVDGTNIKIYNNTVFNNEYIGIWCDSGSGHEIKNNISYGNGDRAIYNNCGAATSNNLTSNPSFVDSTKTDFRLQGGSAAINAGVNLGSNVPDDHAGNSRPQGSAYDIGAYEYSGESLAAPSNLQVSTP